MKATPSPTWRVHDLVALVVDRVHDMPHRHAPRRERVVVHLHKLVVKGEGEEQSESEEQEKTAKFKLGNC